MIARPIVMNATPVTRCSTLNFTGSHTGEEMLISAVMPIMSLYRLPQGQYGYTGHVVNLPQDVAQSVPRLPSDLDVIVVRREGANQTHRDF